MIAAIVIVLALPVHRIDVVVERPFRPGDVRSKIASKALQLGNRISAPSREDVIRRELLFHVGDEWDEARAAESVRILRDLSQIADARIETTETADGVDVRVVVRNEFPWEIEAEVRLEGDQPAVDVPLFWDNVLGTHHSMRFDLLRDLHATGMRDAYRGPRFLGSTFDVSQRASVTWRDRFDGWSFGMSAQQPFRSIYDRWRFAIVADALQGTDILYEGRDAKKPVLAPDGRLVAEGETAEPGSVELPLWGFAYRRKTVGGVIERSVGTKWKAGAGVYADWYDARATHLADVRDAITPGSAIDRGYRAAIFPVDDETVAGVVLSQSRPSFTEMRNVDRFRIAESKLDGWILAVAAGRARTHVETRGSLRFGANVAPWLRVDAMSQAYARALDRGGWSHAIVANRARIHLLGTHDTGSVVLDGDLRAAWNADGVLVGRESVDLPGARGSYLDPGPPGIGGVDVHARPSFPFYAGASTGFRAFRNNALVGDRFARGSFEIRTRSIERLSADWGVVLFYEAGRVWNAEDGFRRSPLLQDVGAGIRLQVVGAFPTVFRIDTAYALTGPRRDTSTLPINLVMEESF